MFFILLLLWKIVNINRRIFHGNLLHFVGYLYLLKKRSNKHYIFL